MVNHKFRARWGLYLAGMSVPLILRRERFIKKHREVQILAERFMQAQEALLAALWGQKNWGEEVAAADAAFVQLGIRRGMLS